MPIPGQMPFDINDLLVKSGFVLGFIIILYALIWMLAELHLIPAVVYMIFPQIVLLCIGIFIVYIAYKNKNKYY